MAKRYRTKLTEMLGMEYPILAGGMQWISRAEFVATVCNAGGTGFITAESLEKPEDLREEIKKIRDLTDKPFGINLSMVPEFGEPKRTLHFCDVVCECGIKFVETAGRSPEPLMPVLKQGGVKVIHKLTSVRHAIRAEKLGVDAVTILGYGSGGHIGNDNVASFIQLPLAIKELSIPIIAGGGIATGAGFLGALAMGAEGVLMGTAFFASAETPIHADIKQKLVDTRVHETMLLLKSIGNPIRVARNRLAEETLALESSGASLEEVITKVAGGKGKQAYMSGDAESSPLACGQTVGLIDEVKPVKQIIDDIIAEADALLDRLNSAIS
ncbi:MAG: nitronate monooxygenase [Deltaproteobacteria bacterium]|jgi:NADH:quinone reductase (non-electrogenic)|nr:nitronate monooxygenase [Deltaproteobacteria bacterium]MBT4641665.1 nitronate monooxygenase [Deltaproteobacteria bacterium]MBT6615477.1 nitronate monooxygenase [Deltaproteobacteria bacterium]MBT7155643.1 nitronate monooxygenase [Deltaproteobacteria bacterium]MBT7715116.1 nitronate monooxygenase [Deltaproteobacteria bacterium]